MCLLLTDCVFSEFTPPLPFMLRQNTRAIALQHFTVQAMMAQYEEWVSQTIRKNLMYLNAIALAFVDGFHWVMGIAAILAIARSITAALMIERRQLN